MALIDWVINTSNDITIDLETEEPLSGNACLHIVFDGNDRAGNMHLDVESYSGFTTGFKAGRIRSIIGSKVMGFQDSGEDLFYGFSFLQSALDVSGTSGTGYFAGIGKIEGTSDLRAVVFKFTNGLSGTSGRTMYFSEAFASSVEDGDHWPVQVTWDLNLEVYNGLRITLAIGDDNSMDFVTLGDVFDRVIPEDDFTPLAASLAFICWSTTNVPGDEEFLFDETTITQRI